MNISSCPLSGGRALHSTLIAPTLIAQQQQHSSSCARPVLEDVASASLAVVATYSSGSLAAASGFQQLNALGVMLLNGLEHGAVRAIVVGKGTRCTSGKVPFGRWRERGKAHCIEGSNVGARESHTIWAFCHDFYRHLPAAMLFVQDDPNLASIKRDLATWPATLEASFAARRRVAAAAAAAGRPVHQLEPWLPSACACSVVREPFEPSGYGGYRPMHWWLRSFLAPFANASAPFPSRIYWPATAQFAVARAAVRHRSREWYGLNMRLTELPAPLKYRLRRDKGTSDTMHAKLAKWANFGPFVVDLGPPPARGQPAADRRPGINGMDAAQLYERSWFQIFDPALGEARPAYTQCFERAALAMGPMRCHGAACPHAPMAGGCAATDAAGVTSPPVDWRYANGKPAGARCLGGPCLASAERGSAAWAAEPTARAFVTGLRG